MTQITTLGLDLGKRVFQVHGVDAAGQIVLRQKLQRGQVVGFFADLAPASSASRPALPPTTGLA